MRPKTLALLAVAAMCGLVAMMGVQQVLSKQGDGTTPTSQVLVAKAEILPGQPLNENNVEFKEWPAGNIPEGAVSQKEQFQDRTLKVRTFPGEMILEAKLDKKGSRSASSQIPKGKYISSVPIDTTMSGTGLIQPGDRVDVLVTYRPATMSRDLSGIGMEVKTVLENVEVFAIDGVTDAAMIARAGDPKAVATKNVSLLVTSEQSRLVKLAGELSGGKLHLTLRGMNDDTVVAANDLFDPSKAEAAVSRDSENDRDVHRDSSPGTQPEPVQSVNSPSKNKKWKIEIIAGSERRIEEVDLPDTEPVTLNNSQGT
jgi:pilus assembly protein CpaB